MPKPKPKHPFHQKTNRQLLEIIVAQSEVWLNAVQKYGQGSVDAGLHGSLLEAATAIIAYRIRRMKRGEK